MGAKLRKCFEKRLKEHEKLVKTWNICLNRNYFAVFDGKMSNVSEMSVSCQRLFAAREVGFAYLCDMKSYQLINNLMGWLVFAVAATVYCLTIEPTASFWDCPEFILSAYKLEVGHPPGAPFFMLAANVFSQLASDSTQVARMINLMNALLSASCIMFLYWSITLLVRRIYKSVYVIVLSGCVGALIYTFSDTFWFSAVEGEVYAFSSAFTAVVFWLMLKWENHADEPHRVAFGSRW